MGRAKVNVLRVDGRELTVARVRKGLRGQDVADYLAGKGIGCNRSAVSRWERGLTKPTDAQILAMAELLETKEFVIGGAR